VSFSVAVECLKGRDGVELTDQAMDELKEYAWDLMVGGEAMMMRGEHGWSFRPAHNGQMDTAVHRVR